MLNKLIGSIRNQHELIFKVLLFAIAITVVVFLLPKEATFKYEFQKNKPWVHEDLLAPFDFAINKTEEELINEQLLIQENHLFYFDNDKKIKERVIKDFSQWVNKNWKDSTKVNEKNELIKQGVDYLEMLYTIGIVEIIDELDGRGEDYTVLLLDDNNILDLAF